MPEVPLRSLRGHVGDTPGLLGSYLTRVMLGMVAALSFLLVLIRLPLHEGPRYVDVRQGIRTEPNQLQNVAFDRLARAAPEAPITRFEEAEAVPPEDEGEDEETSEEEAPQEPVWPREPPPQQRMTVMEVSEQMPQVAGGLGAFYIHIQYPPAAARAGIEGNLVLSFIVEPDGRPSNIRVLKSLHPLCDSAAVRALRQTYFVPGRQNGDKVRVRMRLPVRFQLLDGDEVPGDPISDSGS